MIPIFSNSLDAACWWLQRGYSPIPIPSGSKNPGFEGWENLRLTAATAPQYFNGSPQNIGILLGLDDATDADLDIPEAISVGPQYLPPTHLTWGRLSKPASHGLYRSHNLRIKKFCDPLTKKAVCELRGLKSDGTVGLQSIVPHSVHATGEQIEFVKCGEPAVVSPEILQAAMSRVAAAALLAAHWPAHGRHNSMLALAGILARANWPEAEARKFCRALYGAVQTHDSMQLSRSDSEVSSTYEKHSAGEAVTGFPTLLSLMEPRVVQAAMGWLNIQAPDWRTSLVLTPKGAPRPVLLNGVLALELAPEWAGVLGFNEHANLPATLKDTPWNKKPGNWSDSDDLRLCDWLQRERIYVSPKTANEAAQTASLKNGFHPLRQYLDSLAWDGVQRLEDWLPDHFGAENTTYVRAIGARWLTAAVARAYRPGCQCDSTLLLLGPQGSQKSSALRALAVRDEWFTDNSSAELGQKDSRIELIGKWIVEMSELDRVRGAHLERVKAFLVCRIDNFRLPYGRRSGGLSRTCIFAATSNSSTPLTDCTGGRRFWPIHCVGKIDVAGIEANRDSLWAEAVHRFKRGDAWYMNTEELEELATAEQRAVYEPGPLDDAIMSWVASPQRRSGLDLPWYGSVTGKISTTDVLLHALGTL